jgi:dimethylaniline monooxygenase (N-oxide forming)
MRKDYQAEQRRMGKLYPNRPRYGLELDPREYGLALREDLQQARKALEAQKGTESAGSEDLRVPVG